MPVRPMYHKPRHTPTRSADEERGNSTSRGYGRDWSKVRARYLAENPLCFLCLKRGKTMAATIVDHKVPVAVDPSRRLDADNLRSCCVGCHAEITTNFKLTGRNEPRLATGGWA